ncbi:transporter substrate-binding domain-containing diguanylate cyclase [Maridesulfovibrio frigidus]|uniref:transporter substrate-binding domain-containing diguanylate cyclase n=1 Tax=Maridesulfovibrio frigidus TaxID=340956 RepID=UPI0006912FB0|nr:transporter substrate-binding domain-containing protein [Maridesulfovibrio frigidus]
MKRLLNYMLLFLALLTLVGGAEICFAVPSSGVELTKEEAAFIIAHPEIKLGTEKDWEPHVILNQDGSISGIDADILSRINKATGANFQLEAGNWVEMQERAKAGLIDGLSTGAVHEERKEYLNFSDSYMGIQKMLLVSLGNPKNIKSNEDLKGKVLAVHKGNMVDEKLARTIDGLRIIEFETIKEVIEAVVHNEADATFGNGATIYSANKLGLPYLQIAYPLGEELKLVFGVRKDWPEAISILNKGLASIPDYEKLLIRNKWLAGSSFPDYTVDQIIFDDDEQKFLNGIDSITMCVDPSWMPYELVDKNGEYVGLVADYMKLLSMRVGKKFQLVPTDSWGQTLSFVRERKCDIIPSVIPTPKRLKYLNFTSSYLSFPLVVATSRDELFVDNFDAVADQTFAVVKNYAAIELLKEKYPNLKIVEVEDALTGLEKVHEKGVFGYIDTVSSISYQIQKNGLFDVKISGQLDISYDLAIGVRNDMPQLLSILNKGIASFSNNERQELHNSWITVHYDKGLDYSLLWKILAGLSVFPLLLLYRYNIVSRYNKKLILMNSKLDSLYKTDRLTGVFNRHMLDEEMKRELARAGRYHSYFSVIILDIDHFKKVNDTYGHHVGDTVLVAISCLLSGNVRETDVVGRWGGEEFLIICPEVKIDGATRLAEKLRGRVEALRFEAVKGSVTASFGVASFVKGESSEDLIKRADRALYKAKDISRNCVVVAD